MNALFPAAAIGANEKETDPSPRRKPTLADLPSPDTSRWVTRRKAEVVAGVRAGLLTAEEACQRYNLSAEEFASWQKMVDRYGVQGLRVTRLQEYRRGDR